MGAAALSVLQPRRALSSRRPLRGGAPRLTRSFILIVFGLVWRYSGSSAVSSSSPRPRLLPLTVAASELTLGATAWGVRSACEVGPAPRLKSENESSTYRASSMVVLSELSTVLRRPVEVPQAEISHTAAPVLRALEFASGSGAGAAVTATATG